MRNHVKRPRCRPLKPINLLDEMKGIVCVCLCIAASFSIVPILAVSEVPLFPSLGLGLTFLTLCHICAGWQPLASSGCHFSSVLAGQSGVSVSPSSEGEREYKSLGKPNASGFIEDSALRKFPSITSVGLSHVT